MVTGRRRRVEYRVGLLVAVETGLALYPANVTPRVDHQVVLPRRTSDTDAGEVLAASQFLAGGDRRLERLRQEQRLVGDTQQGLEVRRLDAAQGQFEVRGDGLDPGRVAGEAGAGQGGVVLVVVFVEGGTGVERDGEGRRLSNGILGEGLELTSCCAI